MNTNALGEKIQYYRLQAGLTQKELALKAGIAQPTLSALERGRLKTFPITNVDKLADALHISLDTLFYDSIDKFKSSSSPKSIYELRFRELIPDLDHVQLQYFNEFYEYKLEQINKFH